MTRARHLFWQALVAVAVLLVVSAAAFVLVVRSGWFREKVRQRIIAEVENATGGRVEVGNFSFKWETLTARISPFVLHGDEPVSEIPLLRVEAVTVGLRVISLVERKVDLASLRVENPRLRVVIYPDGSNNLPEPRGRRNGKDWAQNLVDLAVRQYAVTGGLAEVDIRRVPLNFSGEDLRVQMTRDSIGARYTGRVASRHLRIAADFMQPAEADMNASFALDGTRLSLTPLRLAVGGSRVELNGSLTNLRLPIGTFQARAQVAVRDAAPMFSLPVKPVGSASFDGDLSVSFVQGFDYTLSGRATAKGLAYAYQRLRIEDGTASAALNATLDRLTLRGINASALGAKITGQAELSRDRAFHFQGNVDGLEVRQLVGILTDRPVPWNGVLAGTVDTEAILGQDRARLRANASIVPAATGMPIEGQIAVEYDQAGSTVHFVDSHVSTPATNIAVSGTLDPALRDSSLDVRARTTNLDDVLTALAMTGDGAPRTLPLQLNRGGEISIDGRLTGNTANPEFRGQIAVANASLQGRSFDRLNGRVEAGSHSLALRGLMLVRGQTQISGDASMAAGGASGADFMDGPLAAQLVVKGASLSEMAHELGIVTDARGTASANVRLAGTAHQPEAEIAFDAAQVALLGEQSDRVRATLRYTGNSFFFSGGQADLGAGKLLFTGSFEHAAGDFKDGAILADVTAQNIALSRIAALRNRQPGVEARLDAKFGLQGQVERGVLNIRAVNGEASARAISFDKDALGDVTISAATSSGQLALRAKATLRGTTFDGEGKWRMDGDLPGSATFRFPRLTVAALHDLVMLRGTTAQKTAEPPMDGFLEGSGSATLSLLAPDNFQAEVKIETMQLSARSAQTLRLGVQPQDVQIRNAQPILVAVNAKEARIRAAHFTARDTDLEASGVLPFTTTGGADLAVKGTVNLAVLQLLNSDLLARGTANVTAAVRGSLRDPQMNGRMDFTNASFYMSDVPSGIDSASGSILFDRNRATIERLTAEAGGGQVALRGFLEFGDALIYRLQADARGVRVRYPEDVSFTGNAQLALSGTSDASTLSGAVTLNRAAISQGVDLGKLLALAAKPSPAPPNPNEYLRGMRFDVHVGNAPTFELETSLTRNVEAEVDLRLRGTPLRPALLGTISVNSGEIQVFGNRYTVNRGDLRFLDPVKIEPTFDMDLETRTRGITVNVTISGSAEKLNVNYSSDPPLQSREIIALLAVGRDPTTLSSAAQFSSSTSGFSDAGGLLGEAVSQQLSNRLQRFFGASRVKIDPTLTGVENLPSARLTIEQQVSRDVTVTYITNLNRTQEQIVRLEWDFNRQWSAVAVRNSNGLFGIDFQYKKRFK